MVLEELVISNGIENLSEHLLKYLSKEMKNVIRDLKEVSTGMNMNVKHFHGTIVEYIEHKINLKW